MTSGWWTEAFRSAYLEVYHHRTDEQAAGEIAGLLPRLRQAPGPLVDAGCGAGRHLQALRAAGLPVFGFDLSPDLLGVAAQRPAVTGRLARADLRAPPCAAGCGAVLCLFTAFGYFDDAANAACLSSLAGLLAPGGWLVLDLPDPERLRAGLQPVSERRTPRGWVVREQRRLVGARVEKTVEATPPQATPIRWQESVRLYDRSEIRGLGTAAGLVDDGMWTSLAGADQPGERIVAWLRRPALT
ncbi:MAG TPA: hypothetical protein DCS97_08415 [Planctomycetes bacterium]|nr:hypothetical protein [Planctomycetota bacterium]